MQDVKKTVLWVLVGFCMISVVVGVFSLFAFLQMATTNISSIGIGDEEKTFFTANTAVAIVCAVAGIAFVIYASIQFLKNDRPEKSKSVRAFLIATLIISVLFIVYPFLTPSIFKLGNGTFDSFGSFESYEYFYYSTFVHYQSYLSATLSTFIPLLIGAGLVFGTLICRNKFQKHN